MINLGIGCDLLVPAVQGPEPRGERLEVYHGTSWRGMQGILLNGFRESEPDHREALVYTAGRAELAWTYPQAPAQILALAETN